jgi:hypothetical protein
MSRAGRYASGALALLPILEPLARIIGRLVTKRKPHALTPEECDREAEAALREISAAAEKRRQTRR